MSAVRRSQTTTKLTHYRVFRRKRFRVPVIRSSLRGGCASSGFDRDRNWRGTLQLLRWSVRWFCSSRPFWPSSPWFLLAIFHGLARTGFVSPRESSLALLEGGDSL